MTDRTIRVKLTETVGPDQHPERGLFTVSPDEARLLVRGVVTQLARERLGETEGTPTEEQVLSEASDVLAEIEADIEDRIERRRD